MPETIYFNGKKYNQLAEMPPKERSLYERANRFFADADRDGVPDRLQSNPLAGLIEAAGMFKEVAQANPGSQAQISIIRETDAGIFINGRFFRTPADMPEHIRLTYEQITRAAQEGRAEIYDEPWRKVDRDNFFRPHDDETFNRQIRPSTPVSQPAIADVNGNSAVFLLLAAGGLVLCAAIVAMFFLLF